MSTIVTRAGKGSALTHNEVDANFTNLNTDKIQSGNTVAALTITSADINGGTIDGTSIGSSSASTGAFTTLSSTGNTTLGDASTDTVTVNGYMGVGGAANSAAGLFVRNKALTGTGQFGVYSSPTGTSAATSRVIAYYARAETEATAFTANSVEGLAVGDAIKGAGSTIANQHGIRIEDINQGTNNFGVTSAVSSGTNKWNIYASGTAANYFAGDVGIGTTSPTKKLHLVGDAIFTTPSGIGLQLYNNSSNQSYLQFTNTVTGQTSTSGFQVGIDADEEGLVWHYRSEPIKFGTNATERMRINSSGNVGIGTTSPSYKLDVTGDINVTGDFRKNGTVFAGLTGGQTGSAPLFAARAWVNFDGTGTVAIRASGNVSSITDNGTGDYTVNFTTAMPDANYCVVRSTSSNSGTADFYPPADLGTITTSSVRFITGYITNFTADGVVLDLNNIHVAIFR
jgi:hypothetical protein